mgnify:CR=1 FL=1|jgi:hypothetical protein
MTMIAPMGVTNCQHGGLCPDETGRHSQVSPVGESEQGREAGAVRLAGLPD